MDRLLQIGLSNAVAAAVLALIAAGAGVLFRRPPLTRALWVLVLLKLLTPPLWSVPVWHADAPVARSLAPVERPKAASDAPVSAPIPDLMPDDIVAGEIVPDFTVELDRGGNESPSSAPRRAAPAQVAIHWSAIIADVWLLGCGVYVAAVILAAVRLRWLIRRSRPAHGPICRRVAELSARLGLRRCPAVCFVQGPISPMLCAIVASPRIVLPSELWEKLSEDQRDTVLAHELAHLRRRDHWMTVLELLVSALYWWYPLVWWARRELREATEQCCDAWVVWSMPRAAVSYAAALVEAVEFISTTRPAVPALASGMGQFTDLKRRLVMIKQGNARRALSRPGLAAVCCAAGLLLPLAPSFAQNGAPVAPVEAAPNAAQQVNVDAPRPERPRDAESAPEAPNAPVAAQVEQDRAEAERDQAQAERDRAKADQDRAQAQREQAERRYQQEFDRARREVERAQQQLVKAQQRLAEVERRVAEQRAKMSADMFGRGPRPERGQAALPRSPEAFGGAADRVRAFGQQPRPAGGGADAGVERRLDAMERQMQDMMNALRQMRRQMRSSDGAGESRRDGEAAK